MRSLSGARVGSGIALLLAGLAHGCASAPAKIDFAQYVWPPPPDPPRIQLEDVVLGRAETLAKSRFQRALLGASPRAREAASVSDAPAIAGRASGPRTNSA